MRPRVPQLPKLPERAPLLWPRFTSTLHSPAVAARVGVALGAAFGLCFATGLLSHWQYQQPSWLPLPAAPSWGYRVTQGAHVISGTVAIPLLLLKLWTVYPRLFEWPPVRGGLHGLERASIAVLLSSSLVQLTTGFLNSLDYYPWPWSFVSVHRYLSYVVIGSLLLHIAVKLPVIRAALTTPLADGDRAAAARRPPGEPPGQAAASPLVARLERAVDGLRAPR